MLIVLPSILVVQARAESVNITVSHDSVAVEMKLLLQENLTDLSPVDIRVGPGNTSAVIQSVAQPINNTIQSLVTGARLSSLEVEVKAFNNTGIWNLEEDYSMVVTGANTNSGSNIGSNLAFIPMHLTSPIQLNGMELNSVGPAVILPALEAKAAQYSNLKYYIDGSNPRTATIPEQTTKEFSLLDFTWIAPISTWTSNQNILGQSTSWTYDPLAAQYNLTLGIPSPEGILIRVFTAIYTSSVSVTVPAIAWIKGNTVYFDIPTTSEIMIPAIIVAALIIAVVTVFFDRRFTRQIRLKKRR